MLMWFSQSIVYLGEFVDGWFYRGLDSEFVAFFRTCILVSEFVFMLLAIRRAAIIWRETCKINGLNLAKVLIRDQACYFMAWVSSLPFVPACFLLMSTCNKFSEFSLSVSWNRFPMTPIAPSSAYFRILASSSLWAAGFWSICEKQEITGFVLGWRALPRKIRAG